MATVNVTLANGDSITITNEFLDEAAAIAVFISELQKALEGPIIPQLQEVLTQIIMSTLQDLISKMILKVFGSYTLWNGFPNPVVIAQLPDAVLREIGHAANITIPTSSGALIAMGQKTIAEAEGEFISKLGESLSSSYVVTALTNVTESLIRAGQIYDFIISTIQSVADSMTFSGYISFNIPTLTIPKIEIPTVDISITIPTGTGMSATIQADLRTIEQFQSELMSIKIYDVISAIESTLVNVVTSEIQSMIDAVVADLPPMPI